MVIIFECVKEIVISWPHKLNHFTNELSYGAICFSAFNRMNFGNFVEFCPFVSSIHIVRK